MTASILVATPHAPFGELLRMSLEESGQYQVRLVQSGSEARATAGRVAFQLAIMDSSIADEPFVPLCLELIKAQEGLRLVVIPPENNPNHPALGGLLPHGYLSRPFYLPDLINTVSRLLHDREHELRQNGDLPAASAFSVTLPPWLQEPMTLAAYLEKELESVPALAGIVGLIGHEPGTGMLRAFAGAIEREAAEELGQTVFRYWNRKEKTDLMRFLRLSSSKRDYLIYATQISGDLVLVLAYDNAAPLSLIRPQAKEMARRLASLPPEGYNARPQAQEAGGTPAAPLPVPAAGEPLTEPATGPLDRARPAQDENFFDEEDPLGEEAQVINLSALLGEIPSPDPGQAGDAPAADAPREADFDRLADAPREDIWSIARPASAETPTTPRRFNGWEHEEPLEEETAPKTKWPFLDQETVRLPESKETGEEPTRPLALPVDHALPVEPSPPPEPPQEEPARPEEAEQAVPQELTHRQDAPHPEDVPHPEIAEEKQGETPGEDAPVPEHLLPKAGVPTPDPAHLPAVVQQASVPVPDTPGDPLEDTNPGVITTISQISQLEPASPAVSLLNYTCVLVPRLPQHFLTGELAEHLSQWLAQLCLSYGWRLEGIAVRPEYLQWSVQVAPAVSPGNLVRIIRQRTSFYIFNTFPHMATENPSGDFWATGYLIVSGPQPPSAQLLRDYIAQTRKRQGLSR